MKLKEKNFQSGFTLIEVMVVMVILATLAVFVVPKFMDEPKRAQRLKARVTISNMETALKTCDGAQHRPDPSELEKGGISGKRKGSNGPVG